MKYKVRVSELRYGEVEVDAASEREAKSKATRARFDFFDSEITDLTVEKVVSNEPRDVIERLESWANGDTCDGCPAKDDTVFQAVELLRKAYLEEIGPHTYIVTETCPHCESEIEMIWNTDERGFKAFCPVCGKRLMLCDECLHTGKGQCVYSNDTDSCRYNPAAGKKLWMRLGVMLNVTPMRKPKLSSARMRASLRTLCERLSTLAGSEQRAIATFRWIALRITTRPTEPTLKPATRVSTCKEE